MAYTWTKHELHPLTKVILNWKLRFQSGPLRRSFKRGRKDLELKLRAIGDATSHAEIKGLTEVQKLWNVAGFMCLISLDLKVLGETLLSARSFRDEQVAIKHLCTLIYDTLRDIEELLGKDFYKAAETLRCNSESIEALNQRKKTISQFKREHEVDLKRVRTIVGAHRDHDFRLQLKTLEDLERTSFIKILIDFDGMLNSLSEPMQDLLNQSVQNLNQVY